MKKLIIGSALAISLSFSTLALADGKWWCGDKLDQMTSALKLDSTQQSKMKSIRDEMKSSGKNMHEKMDGLRTQLKDQVFSDNMDQSKVDSLIDEKAGMIKNMMKAEINAKHQVYLLLNPQQKAEFKQKMQQMSDEMAMKYKSCHE